MGKNKIKIFNRVNKLLVVAAHPDDEVLGAGGTLLKHSAAGDEISLLFLSEGESARNVGVDIKKRQEQARRVGELLTAKNIIFHDLPDNKMDTLPFLKIAKTVEAAVNRIKPNRIYTHHGGDLNLDHRLTFEAVITACRPQPDFFVKEILTFEILSSTEWQAKNQAKIFCPNWYENISDQIGQKKDLFKKYRNEIRPYPHPRSLEGIEILAQYRGLESGFEYAEAFQLIRLLKG